MRSGPTLSFSRSFRLVVIAFLALLPAAALQAQATAPALSLGSVNVKASTTGPVTFTFSASTTVSSIAVVTQGVANLDYTLNSAAPGTCVAKTYAASATCTVGVKFTPQGAGTRTGGVMLATSTNPQIGVAHVYGIGLGGEPIVTGLTPTIITGPSGFAEAISFAAGPNGVIYASPDSSSGIYKETPNGSTFTQTTVTTGLVEAGTLAVDGLGNVFIMYGEDNELLVETLNPSTGTYTQSVAVSFDATQCFGLGIDASGNLYAGCKTAVYKETPSASGYTQTTVDSGFTAVDNTIAVDAAGDLFFTDVTAGILYKETFSAGAYTRSTIASGLTVPGNVALDPAGNLYVGVNTSLNVYTPSGSTYTSSTLSSGGNNVSGVAITSAGNIYLGTAPGTYVFTQSSEAFNATGTTAVGSVSAQQTATIKNIGNANLVFTSLAASGPATSGSSTTCATSSPVLSEATCVVGVEFSPTTHGASPQTGTITLNSNGASIPLTITGDVTGDPISLAFTSGPPATVIAGTTAGSVQVTLDSSANTPATSGNTLPVTLTVTYPNLSTKTYGPTNAVAGVATFNTAANALTASGTYGYSAASPGLTGATASETVIGGAVASLVITPAITTAYVGSVDNISLTAYDAYGNLASSSTDTIALTATDTTATLPANFGLSGGIANEPVTFNHTGTFTVTASDVTNIGVPAATTVGITVQTVPGFTVGTATDPGGSGTAANCPNQAVANPPSTANCSLRDAIAAINAVGLTGATSSQPIINFTSAVVTANPILHTSAALSPTANFNLVGPGAVSLTISPSGTGHVFVSTGTASIAMTVSGLTLNGFGVFGSTNGGAWSATGSGHIATFSNDIFTNNTGAVGGAISDSNGTVMLTNSAFTSNNAQNSGGALYLGASSLGTSASPASGNIFTSNQTIAGGAIAFTGASTSYLSTSLFSNNKASGVEAEGGAIAITIDTATNLTITNSLFSGNSATATHDGAYGGAIFQIGGASASSLTLLALTGDTFTGNQVTTSASNQVADGGAIYVGEYVIDPFYNDTITANTAISTGFRGSDSGGGISLTAAEFGPTVYNTIVAANISEFGPDLSANVNGCASTVCNSTAADTGILLSALGNYGGYTIGPPGATRVLQTIIPLPGSTALAEGSTSSTYVSAGETDARGYPRTTTYNGTTHIDAGAVETNYTLAFVQEPSNTTVNTAFSPVPSVQIYESGVPFNTTGGKLAVSAAAGTPSASSIAITASPAIINVTFPKPELDDTLIASINNSTTPTPTVVASTTSTAFNISDKAATLGFGTPPPAQVVTGGNAGTVTVDELLANGSINTAGNDTITLKVSATGYTTATYTAAVVNGVATFNLSADALTLAGTYTYTASASTYTTDTVAVTETVAADIVDHFVVSGIPSVAAPGTAYTFTVTAADAGNATDIYFTGPVSLTSTDRVATFLPQNYTFVASDNGTHTFTVTFATNGIQSVTATDNTGQTGSETNIDVFLNYVWLVNATGTVDKLTDSGTAVGGAVGMSGNASTLGGVAFDSAGNVWSVTNANNTLDFVTKTGVSSATYSGGGLNAPVSVAVDGQGYIWIANSGNNTVSAFNNSGTALSPAAGYGTSDALSMPSSVVIDNTGGVWVTSKNGNSVTHIFGAAAPVVTPTASDVTNATLGVKP
jgi:large repetitive protein